MSDNRPNDDDPVDCPTGGGTYLTACIGCRSGYCDGCDAFPDSPGEGTYYCHFCVFGKPVLVTPDWFGSCRVCKEYLTRAGITTCDTCKDLL